MWLVSYTARGSTVGGPAHAAAAAGARPLFSKRARTRHAPPTPPHRNDLSADGCLGVTSDILFLRTPTARQRVTAHRHHAHKPARSQIQAACCSSQCHGCTQAADTGALLSGNGGASKTTPRDHPTVCACACAPPSVCVGSCFVFPLSLASLDAPRGSTNMNFTENAVSPLLLRARALCALAPRQRVSRCRRHGHRGGRRRV